MPVTEDTTKTGEEQKSGCFIAYDRSEASIVFAFRGRTGVVDVTPVCRKLESINGPLSHCIIDFSELTHFATESMGIALMIRDMLPNSVDVRIVNVSPEDLSVMEACRLERRIKIPQLASRKAKQN